MSEPDTFADFLRKALRILRRRSPEAYQQVHLRLRGLILHLQAGRENLTVFSTSQGLRVAHGLSKTRPQIRARFAPDSLVRMVDGVATFADLLETEEVWILGREERLLRCHEATLSFLEVAVRSPSLQQLFEAYRLWTLSGTPPESARAG